jgi:signal peptidase
MPTPAEAAMLVGTTRAVARSRAEGNLIHVPTPHHPTAAVGDDQSAFSGPEVEVPTDGTSEPAGPAEPRRPRTIRRWLGRLFSLVATVAVLGIVGLALALTAVPAAVGGHALTVLSGSMVPEFSPGAMVVDRPTPAESLRVGDVITYATTDQVSGAPILITHRIVEVRPSDTGPTFITQGDANDNPDTRPVEASQVRGEVWYSVPYIGTARNFLLAQGAGLILAGAAGLGVAIWLLTRAFRSEPAQDAPARPGRHRTRNGAMAAVLVGLLGTSTHAVADSAGTAAYFSDQQSVSFEITVGSADPAQ